MRDYPQTQQPAREALADAGHFERRVQDECDRADERGGRFAVARISAPKASAAAAFAAIAHALGAGDGVAIYAPGEYEALLLEGAPERVAEALVAARLDAKVG